MRRTMLRYLSAGLILSLAGCEALYFATGKGSQDALYKLPKDKRVLVFVDPRPTSNIPVDVPAALGEKINDHLYQYKAADKLIPQQRLVSLRQEHANFEKLGIADVAKATEADLIVYVDLLAFKAENASDGQLTEGAAQALVKVVDRDGNRLWPTGADVPGAMVSASVPAAFSEQRDVGAVKRQLIDDLATRAGRIFHSYAIEDEHVKH